MRRVTKQQLLTRYIYVIGPVDGLQKIGLATDPRNRLSALQTACPFELVLHACVAVPFGEARSVEYRAHQLLSATRVRNEWFETTPADAVAAIHAAAAEMPRQAQGARSAPEPAWRVSPIRLQRSVEVSPPPPILRKLSSESKAQRPAQLGLFDRGRSSNAAVGNPGPDTPLEALTGYRLEIQCCAGLASYPLHHLASSLPEGGQTPLASIVRRFRCERCRRTAREATLVADAGDEAGPVLAWRVEGPR